MHLPSTVQSAVIHCIPIAIVGVSRATFHFIFEE